MTWSGYNTEPSNFNFEVEKYADNSAQIKGVGCAGTNEGSIASKSNFVEPPYITGGSRRRRSRGKRSRGKRSRGKRSRGKRSYIGGNSGYEFTQVPIAPVAGPGAPYSEVKGYNTLGNYRTSFPPLFKGGKKRIQYGCNKSRVGRKKSTKRRYTSRRYGGKRYPAKRSWMMRGGMRGGMNSNSDFTNGRNSSQDQPYSNKAISFGQGLNNVLGSNESALASPPPFMPYNDCGKVMRT